MNQLAKRIIDEAIGEAEKALPPQPKEKNKAAQELGRLGGERKAGRLEQKVLRPSSDQRLQRRQLKQDGGSHPSLFFASLLAISSANLLFQKF